MNEHIDKGSLMIIAITFACFFIALFAKGFTHDLLLEIGVFLVSVKLIVMAYKNSVAYKNIQKELQVLKRLLTAHEK